MARMRAQDTYTQMIQDYADAIDEYRNNLGPHKAAVFVVARRDAKDRIAQLKIEGRKLEDDVEGLRLDTQQNEEEVTQQRARKARAIGDEKIDATERLAIGEEDLRVSERDIQVKRRELRQNGREQRRATII